MNDARFNMDPFKRRGELKTQSTSRTVVWFIEHYQSILASEHYICSETFRVPTISNSLFYLFLSLTANQYSLLVFRNTRLRLTQSNTSNGDFRVVIALRDEQNEILIKKEVSMSRDDATPPILFDRRAECVNKGCLEIQCTVINDEAGHSLLFQMNQESSDRLKDFVPHLSCNELKEHLDVILDGEVDNSVSIFVNNEVFQVHKSLLCSHSSVFAAMFQHDTLEKAKNNIYIDDISAEAVGEILSFIYFGNTRKMSHKMTLEVYAAADKYAIINLRKKCASYLISNLTKEVVLDVLIVGDRHSDDELRVAAIHFLVKEAPDVIKTDIFLNLLESDAELARSIILHLTKTVNN